MSTELFSFDADDSSSGTQSNSSPRDRADQPDQDDGGAAGHGGQASQGDRGEQAGAAEDGGGRSFDHWSYDPPAAVEPSEETQPAPEPAAEDRPADREPDLEQDSDQIRPADRGAQVDGEWEAYLPRLKARFPEAREGTLFCVWKLESDPNLMLRDFKHEATLRGVGLSGRSIHSARVLLGLEQPVPPRPRRRQEQDSEVEDFDDVPPPAAPARRSEAAAPVIGGDLESVLRRAIDEAVETRSAELRSAVRAAIELLRDALGDAK